MIRRLILTIALVASTATAALAYPATLLMRTGERITGELTYRLGGNDVTVNGRDYSLDDVAVIAYVPNDPAPTEVSRVPAMDGNPSELERHVFVTRDGQLIFGKLYKFSADGRIVTFDERGSGRRRDIAADQLARIYINPGSARRVVRTDSGRVQHAAKRGRRTKRPFRRDRESGRKPAMDRHGHQRDARRDHQVRLHRRSDVDAGAGGPRDAGRRAERQEIGKPSGRWRSRRRADCQGRLQYCV